MANLMDPALHGGCGSGSSGVTVKQAELKPVPVVKPEMEEQR